MATAAIGLGAGLVSSLLGGIFGNKPQTTTTDSSGNSTTNQNQNLYGDTANTHIYDTAGINLKNTLLNQYTQSLQSAQPDISGYVNQQLQGNNTNSDAHMTAINQILAARGLNSSPVAGNAIIQNQNMRMQGNQQILNNAPLLAEQIRQQRLQQAGGFFSGMPTDTEQLTHNSGDSYSNTNQTQHQTQTGNGNMAGGGFSSLGSSLAYLSGKGVFGKL